jgi:hypothetical protein
MKKVIISLTALFYVFTAQANTISVATYGAIPNDGLNDKTAITNAINAAVSGDMVIFPTGTYNLDGPGTKILLWQKSNLIIDGQGSTLTCTTWSIVFGCYANTISNNVTVKNFIVNWDNDLPFSGGLVTAKGATYVDVTVQGNHTVRTGLTIGAIFKYDDVNMRPYTNGYDIYQTNATTTTSPSAGVMRCPVVAGSLPSINVGDKVVVRFQVYSGDFFNAIGPNVSNITLDNITVNSEPGMFLFSRSVTNININNINILRKPGLWMTTTADGLHFNNDRGNINVTNSTLESMGDDGLNIHSNYTKITAKAANSITLVDASSGNITYADQDPVAGDSLEVTDPTTLALVAKLYVQSVVRNAGNITVTTTTAVPGAVAVNQFVANAGAVPAGTISNCTIRNNRARGFLIQNRNVNINNCTLQNCSWPGVLVETTASWFFESITPKNVTIQNCIFSNCNYWSGYPGQLAIRAYNGSQAIAPAGVVKNINILDNSFTGSYNATDNRSAIFISAADSVFIRGNTFDPNYFNQSIYWVNTGYNLFINTANPSSASTPNGSAVILPATILAENVDNGGQTIAYFERTMPSPNPTPANSLLQKATCGAGCSGFYVNSIEKNEWTQYSVTLTQPSLYDVLFRVGSTSVGGATFHLERNHVNLTGTLTVAQTGTSFSIITASGITLPQGTYPLRVVVETGVMTFDNVQFSFVSATLPVQVLSFTAKNTDNKEAVLNWTVARETNLQGYQIERSVDGVNFTHIGFVAATGLTDYYFTDTAPLTGKNYYRIKSTDIGGAFKTSAVKTVDIKSGIRFIVTPNPSNTGRISFKLTGIKANTGLSLGITNSAGQLIKTLNLSDVASNTEYLTELGNSGFYFVRITLTNGEIFSEKVLVVK